MNDQVNPTIAKVLNNFTATPGKKMFKLDTTPILDEVFEGFNEIFSNPTPSIEELKKNGNEIKEQMGSIDMPEVEDDTIENLIKICLAIRDSTPLEFINDYQKALFK
jgi:hypothetical protein